jgi:hypothetical protein
MKFGILAVVLFVSACTEQQAQDLWPTQLATGEQPGTKYVKVLGRTWTVYPSAEQTNVYIAQRDNLDLNPYGAPSALRTPQAVRAIEQATGCGVLHASMIQDTSARFFASVNCG